MCFVGGVLGLSLLCLWVFVVRVCCIGVWVCLWWVLVGWVIFGDLIWFGFGLGVWV